MLSSICPVEGAYSLDSIDSLRILSRLDYEDTLERLCFWKDLGILMAVYVYESEYSLPCGAYLLL